MGGCAGTGLEPITYIVTVCALPRSRQLQATTDK